MDNINQTLSEMSFEERMELLKDMLQHISNQGTTIKRIEANWQNVGTTSRPNDCVLMNIETEAIN